MNNQLKALFAAVAVLLVLASSCRTNLEDSVTAGRDRGSDVLCADLEAPVNLAATKLKLDEKTSGTYEMVWAEGDRISVIGTGNAVFTLSSGVGTPNGRFSGSIDEAGTGPYYAVFPYRETASVSGGAIHFTIPQTVGAQQGNVASKTIPCVARVGSEDGPVSAGMHNVVGLLKLTLTSSSNVLIKKITLHDLGGNMLWGDCTVPIKADGEPDYENIKLENGTNTISMLWNGTATISSVAKSFIFPVPAGTLDRGFSVVIYKADSSAEDGVGQAYSFIQKISSPVTAVRSAIINMDNASIKNNGEAKDVKRRGYYKSLFVDAGMFLSNNYDETDIPAISYIGLENDFEYFASHSTSSLTGSTRINDSILQRNIMVQSDGTDSKVKWKDDNGVLVYPDGAPRFRLIYANGGRSYDHGRSLAKDGRDRVHYYFTNGGSYTGSCAGSFLAATWVDGTKRYGHSNPASDWSFGLFPGELVHTHLPPSLTTYPESVLTGMKVLPRLKELGYFNFAETDTLEDIRHHGGSYYPHNARNSAYKIEELMSFQYSNRSIVTAHRYNPDNTSSEVKYNGKFIQIVDSVNTWAYKKNSTTGRVVVTGSHPEKGKTGNVRDFIAMMFLYAMEGNGDPVLKTPDLKMDAERVMDRTTADDDPQYTRIGDRQYHHFKFTTSKSIEKFQIQLSSQYGSESGIDLYLSLRKDGLAWLSDADYVICTKGGNKVINIKSLPAGTWYVGVFCATTVTSARTGSNPPYYWSYTGKTEVLDGVPYTIGIGVAKPGIAGPGQYPGSDIGTDSLDD